MLTASIKTKEEVRQERVHSEGRIPLLHVKGKQEPERQWEAGAGARAYGPGRKAGEAVKQEEAEKQSGLEGGEEGGELGRKGGVSLGSADYLRNRVWVPTDRRVPSLEVLRKTRA